MKRVCKGLAALAAVVAAGAALAADPPGTLSLQGRLAPELTYRVRIDFETTLNDRACKFDDHITGMWIPQVESRFFTPTVNGEAHSLSIPLAWQGAAGRCVWEPSTAYLCVGPPRAEANDCKPLFVVRPVGAQPRKAVAIICDPKSWVCVTPERKDPVQQADDLNFAVQLDVTAATLR